jgi:membrane protein
MQALNVLVSFGVITVLFALLYKYLPDTEIAWHDVWIGSAVTSLLFGIGKLVLGMYLGKASVASSYGAAGSVLILLLWVYYSAMILYFGAEFTKIYADRYGSTKMRRDKEAQARAALKLKVA